MCGCFSHDTQRRHELIEQTLKHSKQLHPSAKPCKVKRTPQPQSKVPGYPKTRLELVPADARRNESSHD
ncbi:E3 ubiquitin-protein ligase [Fusarium oxysporum f. sp. albedinis]|nr:E3 ubiquitin-protein ligase [Fusarium oxysporum f. sp. albedinis]